MAIKHILVPVDFSDPSRQALDHAVRLAREVEAVLSLVHAWNPAGWAAIAELGPDVVGELVNPAKEAARDMLGKWADGVRREGVVVERHLARGHASEAIPERARRERADLVIVGRRGHARLAHVLLGSVSERVVGLNPCPTLVVPEDAAPVTRFPRILVGVDYSAAARDAVLGAIQLAQRSGAPRVVNLLHVEPSRSELENWSELIADDPSSDDPAALREWADQIQGEDVSLETRSIEGRVEASLIEFARAEEFDWICLGAHGYSALAALILGSTTDRVLKLADRPVLVVPPRHAESG